MRGRLFLAVSFTVAGSAALAAGPGPVLQEPVLSAPVVQAEPTGDWGGGYAGVQLGYGFGELNLDPTDIGELDGDGVIGGLHAGYLFDAGNWVLGPEIQYDRGDLDVSSDDGSGSFDEIARLKLRGGRDLGSSLVYGSVGVAYTNFDGLSGVADIDFSDPGYVLGLGYDYRFNDRWTLGGEYQYHMFDDFGEDGNDVDLQTVHLRASYNF